MLTEYLQFSNKILTSKLFVYPISVSSPPWAGGACAHWSLALSDIFFVFPLLSSRGAKRRRISGTHTWMHTDSFAMLRMTQRKVASINGD